MKLLVVAFGPADLAAGAGLAQALGLEHEVLLLTGSGSSGAKILAAGLSEVAPANDLARAVAGVARDTYSHVAAVSSMASKDLMARVAGLLDAGMVTDVVSVSNPTSFVRPVVAGSALATVEVQELPVVMTFRPAGFSAAAGSGGAVESVSLETSYSTKREKAAHKVSSRPDLTQAKVIVSGGRPLKDAETFEKVIGGLADKLGGAVGATRAAVDSGIAGNDLQVGQTGKVVAPDLYIACGISGSTQHMAGIKDSKVIVAINTDPDAPIFDAADFGLVADLFVAVPALMAKI